MNKYKIAPRYIAYTLTIILLITSVTNVISVESHKNYKVGNKYHGFTMEEEQKLKNYKAIGRVFVHDKSGCKVVQFKNQDPNKYFSITFRTPTNDNKGKPHILEHSLLMGGSQKYPVKQLLNYYLKGSLANEMNGYTYADKTVYPFATINEEEFNNLMDVYLDMVFNARIKSSENIFKEEAWHYEINNINEPLKYSGVVLNEMRNGANSSASKLHHGIYRSLFPDTTYNFISGGDPRAIPDLTYEELIEYYETYYHPSNSMIFIYGNTTIEDKLEKLDKEVLNNFKKLKIHSQIVKQEPFSKKSQYKTQYSIDINENDNGKDVISVNYVIGDSASAENIIVGSLIQGLVLNNKNSIFYETMSKAGFHNISTHTYVHQAQEIISIAAINTDIEKKEEFEKAVEHSLRAVIKKGLDSELLESMLNNYELSQKMALAYGRNSAESIYHIVGLGFTYDEPIFKIFHEEDIFLQKLRKTKAIRYFERFIEEKMLNNKFSSVVSVEAVKGLSEQESMEEIKKLKRIKESLTKEELNNIIKGNIELKNWQSTIEPKELIDKLPIVKIHNVNPEIALCNIIEKQVENTKVLYHPMETNGINNITLRFNSNTVSQDKIPYINLMTALIKEIDNNSCSNDTLKKLMLKYTDGINIYTNVEQSIHEKNEYTPVVIVTTNSLDKNLPKSIDIIEKLLIHANYDNKEKLRRLISELKATADMNIYRQAGMIALYKNLGTQSQAFAYMDNLLGLEYYNFIKDINNNFDSKYDDIVNNLEQIHKNVFNKNNLVISFTSEEKMYPKFQKSISNIIENLPKVRTSMNEYSFPTGIKKEAYVMEGYVNYNIQSFDYKEYGKERKGSLDIISTIINDYLWNVLRVKGGAYGAYSKVYENGIMVIYTHSDPRIQNSYDDIMNIPQYLSDESNYESKLNQYKLHALKKYYIPKTPFQRAMYSDNLYFKDKRQEDLEKDIEKILNTTVEDVKSWSKIFEGGLKEKRITTIGAGKNIKECKEIFDEIKPY